MCALTHEHTRDTCRDAHRHAHTQEASVYMQRHPPMHMYKPAQTCRDTHNTHTYTQMHTRTGPHATTHTDVHPGKHTSSCGPSRPGQGPRGPIRLGSYSVIPTPLAGGQGLTARSQAYPPPPEGWRRRDEVGVGQAGWGTPRAHTAAAPRPVVPQLPCAGSVRQGGRDSEPSLRGRGRRAGRTRQPHGETRSHKCPEIPPLVGGEATRGCA